MSTPAYAEMVNYPDVEADVFAERVKQTEALRTDRLPWDCADPRNTNLAVKAMVLGEEVGEVSKAILEAEHTSALYAELVQVAAVAIAIAGSLVVHA